MNKSIKTTLLIVAIATTSMMSMSANAFWWPFGNGWNGPWGGNPWYGNYPYYGGSPYYGGYPGYGGNPWYGGYPVYGGVYPYYGGYPGYGAYPGYGYPYPTQPTTPAPESGSDSK